MQTRTDPVIPEPIRLMTMVTSFGLGGTEGQVNKLILGLDRSRYDLRVGCLNRWGHYLDALEQRDISVTEFPLSSLYKPHAFKQMLRLAAYMRESRVQILHSYNFYANVFAIPAARLAGVPAVVASIRDQGAYTTPAQRRLHKWVARLVDIVLVNAESIRRWLIEEGFQSEKIITIRNGIDIDACGMSHTGTNIREQYHIAPHAPIVLMLSRLDPRKGVDDFLYAAALVSARFPQARFLVVGEKLQTRNRVVSVDHDYHAYLHALTEKLGLTDKVIFTGRRADVATILAESTVSVLPSLSEGIPNTLLESLAAGVPVVATRVGGIPELVNDGDNGLLVPVKSPPELATSIGKLLSDKDLATRLGIRASATIRRDFSLHRMIQDTDAMYRKLLIEKGLPGSNIACAA
jgi:L-malate glycosyltransferase